MTVTIPQYTVYIGSLLKCLTITRSIMLQTTNLKPWTVYISALRLNICWHNSHISHPQCGGVSDPQKSFQIIFAHCPKHIWKCHIKSYIMRQLSVFLNKLSNKSDNFFKQDKFLEKWSGKAVEKNWKIFTLWDCV